jgi:hypothetical protein
VLARLNLIRLTLPERIDQRRKASERRLVWGIGNKPIDDPDFVGRIEAPILMEVRAETLTKALDLLWLHGVGYPV